MSVKVILVGCGNMGYAMLAGWLSSGRLASEDVMVVEPNAELRKRASELGVSAEETVSAAHDLTPQLIVLAVKPQVMASILPDYRRFAEAGAAFLSVAAGIGMTAYETHLGTATPIIRCMPNTPASIGRGMMVTFANTNVDGELQDFVDSLLSASGKVTSIDDEGLMDAVTAVSGSGPAYVFHFIEALIVAGRKAGLPDDTARLLAVQTVVGAASLAGETGEEPAELRRQVTSPNGTTAAALDVLMTDGRLEKLLSEAVAAARDRSIELGK